MGQECSGWKGSQSEHNCVTDTKKSAKTCQKWPKIAQTMAIFHHKWLILWRKKIIFINIQLPMGSGQLLIPFGYLEVPLPAACSLVRRALWNRPAPFPTAEIMWHSKFQTCNRFGKTLWKEAMQGQIMIHRIMMRDKTFSFLILTLKNIFPEYCDTVASFDSEI